MASTKETTVTEYLEKGCGCKFGSHGSWCITNFTRAEFEDFKDSFSELSKEEQDMFVLSFFAMNRLPGKNADRTVPTTFKIYGRSVCRKTFLYLLNFSKKKYQNIADHYLAKGLTSRIHGNKNRLPHNSTPFEMVEHIKSFIISYGQDNALPLPGRVPGYREENIRFKEECLADIFRFV